MAYNDMLTSEEMEMYYADASSDEEVNNIPTYEEELIRSPIEVFISSPRINQIVDLDSLLIPPRRRKRQRSPPPPPPPPQYVNLCSSDEDYGEPAAQICRLDSHSFSHAQMELPSAPLNSPPAQLDISSPPPPTPDAQFNLPPPDAQMDLSPAPQIDLPPTVQPALSNSQDIPYDITDITLNGITRTLHSRALDNSLVDFLFTSTDHLDSIIFLDSFNCIGEDTLTLLSDKSVKVSFSLYVSFIQVDNQGRIFNRKSFSFVVPMTVIYEISIDSICNQLMQGVETLVQNGSKWIPDYVEKLEMCVAAFDSIARLGYSNPEKAQLPKRLQVKKAVVNVCNTGSDCFRYALLSVLHYRDVRFNKHRAIYYQPWINEHNWDGITWPMTAGQLRHFEKMNPSIRINLLEWREEDEEYHVHRIRIAPIPKSTDADVKVICIMAVKLSNLQWHYVGVTNLNRLLRSRGRNGHCIVYCERCFESMRYNAREGRTEHDVLRDHRHNCYSDKPDSIKMPKDLKFAFKKWKNSQRLPYVVYADCESYLEVDKDSPTTRNHRPIAIGLLLVPHPNMKHRPLQETYRVFSGPDCMLEACKYLDDLARKVYFWNQQYAYVAIQMTDQEKRDYEASKSCYVCKTVFEEKGMKKKIREHDHLTGEFRGASCQQCNTKMRVKRNLLPVFFHNSRGYDNHLICQHALGDMKKWRVTIIPQTKEKYISMSASFEIERRYSEKKQKEIPIRMNIEIKDSAQFLLSSLDKLVKTLDDSDFTYCKTVLPSDADSLEYIKKKGVFPYDWFDCVDKLEERQLPSREDFYDSLNLEECSEENYSRALKAWNDLKCETFCDYMLAYLKLDVHQLADVFEKFRNLGMSEDGLDPAHYYTLPGFTLDSALKMSNHPITLLDTADKYEFVESGVRGGFTFVNRHHLKINSQAEDETSYRPEKDHQEMLYIDANNLYGHALSEPLPIGNGTWLNEEDEEFRNFCNGEWIKNTDFVNCDFAYLVEVDLLYPEEIHDATNDLPFAPQKLALSSDYYSKFMKNLRKTEGGNIPRREPAKLLLTQFDKPNYIIHARLLQRYVQLGMKIGKVHKILRFDQAPVFKEYIAYNSEKRKNAKNEFERDFYKLKNNALYGKTVENQRRRLNFKLANTPGAFRKFSSNPSFQSCIKFNENLVGCHLLKEIILLNKPMFIGQAVLDLAKLRMYDLYYIQLKAYESEFNCQIEVVGGDTDSFFLSVKGCGVYKDLVPAMIRDELMETSNYPKEHPLASSKNTARLGCIKDEAKGDAFYEWFLLRPKCYSMLTVEKNEIKRAKGVRQATVRKVMEHKNYKEVYNESKMQVHQQRRISSKNHFLTTLTYNKKSLSIFENKRYWINQNFSLPYGHYSLDQIPPNKETYIENIPEAIVDVSEPM